MNMKLSNYICLLFFVTGTFFISSCGKLTDVHDVSPVNQLSENEAITTVSQAQSVLYGAYGQVKSIEIMTYNPGLTSLRGLTMAPGTGGGTSEASYQNNEVDPEDYYLDAIYTKLYQVINNVNHIIEKAPLIITQDPRRDQIVGEARFLRALCHFYLLRQHGYFFEPGSKYGIVLKKKPIQSATSEPRSNVQDSYAFIIEDLNYAVANSPAFTRSIYVSSQAAMALKAKVLLYQKMYGEAATLAKQVIQSGKFQLETSYSQIFIKKIVNTKEVIFQVPYDDKNDRNNKAFIFRSNFLPSAWYASFMLGDKRDTAVLTRTNGVLRNKKFNNTVFNGQSLTADTEYFLRLDEIYLILAEAIVRSNGSLAEARDSLNVIRARVNMPATVAATRSELLKAIREEKILESGAESGEEWYDLVRFDREGDLDIKTFKPGVVSVTKYVLPLPKLTVQLSNGLVEQNPGY